MADDPEFTDDAIAADLDAAATEERWDDADTEVSLEDGDGP